MSSQPYTLDDTTLPASLSRLAKHVHPSRVELPPLLISPVIITHNPYGSVTEMQPVPIITPVPVAVPLPEPVEPTPLPRISDTTPTETYYPATPTPVAIPGLDSLGSTPATEEKPATDSLAGFDPSKYLSGGGGGGGNTSARPEREEYAGEERRTQARETIDLNDDGTIRDSRDIMQMLRELSVLRDD